MPQQTIDVDALAEQARRLAPAPRRALDVDALAAQARASGPSKPQGRPVQGVPTGKITNSPDGVGGYLEQLEGDIRYGGDSTLIGKALKTLGAQGLNRSVSEGMVERGPASPLLGALKFLRGAQYTQQDPLVGAGQMLSGAAQALEIPLSFVGASPGAVDAALVRTVPGVAKEAAGQAFQELDQAVGHVPVSHDAAISVANRIDELSRSGGSMPKVVNDFINRVTDPMRGQMTYSEARDFYSNATRLSSEEASRLTPVMGRQMGKFTQALGESIQKAADSVGMGEQYANAMKNYSFGAKGEKFIGGLAEALKWLAVAKVAGSTAGSVAKKVTK